MYENDENKDKSTKDYFWQVQGLKSFCKAKSDWLAFDRIHLSFVKHEGKQAECKQSLAIEGAVKLHGSDGALYLSEMILAGAAKKAAEQAKKSDKNMPEPFFVSMGGTIPSRSNKGVCTFRQFSVAPGSKSDFVFQMMSCPGELNETGGIQPVKGAARESIFVPLSMGDLVDFARSIQIEVSAFRTAMLMSTVTEQPAQRPYSRTEDKMLAVIYDTAGLVNRGFPFVVYASKGVSAIKQIICDLLATKEKYVCPPEEYGVAAQLLNGNKVGSAIMNLRSKNSEKTTSLVVVCTNLEN